jgi:hypothetical protein
MRATTLTLIVTVVWLRVYEWVARAWVDVLCFECSKQVRELSTAEGGGCGGLVATATTWHSASRVWWLSDQLLRTLLLRPCKRQEHDEDCSVTGKPVSTHQIATRCASHTRLMRRTFHSSKRW